MPTPGARHVRMEIVIEIHRRDFRLPLWGGATSIHARVAYINSTFYPLRLSLSLSLRRAFKFSSLPPIRSLTNWRAWSSSAAFVDDVRRGSSITHKSALKVWGQRLKWWTVFLPFLPSGDAQRRDRLERPRMERKVVGSRAFTGLPLLFVITGIPLKKIPPLPLRAVLNHI